MRFDSNNIDNYNNNIDDYNKYNDYNSSRPPSGKSKGSVLAIIILVFAAMFVYMAFGIHHMIKKNIEEKMGDAVVLNGDSEKVWGGNGPSKSSYQEKVEYIKTKEELSEKLNEKILNGETDLYLQISLDITKDEIKEVGRAIDPFLGTYSGYTYVTSSTKVGDEPSKENEYASVNFDFKHSDEFYAYDAIVNGKEIPTDNINALKIKVSCETFLKENISDEMTDYEKELAIHDYIVNNCTYRMSEELNEAEHSSYGVFIDRKAVCEGYTRAADLLLRLCNIETKMVQGTCSSENGTSEDHVWNQVKIDGKWYNMDATWDDPTGDTPELRHTYMNVSDDLFSLTHTWEKEKYESCTSMDANYACINGIYFTDNEAFQTFVRNQLEGGNRETIECVASNIDLSEETLAFIFEYDGVGSYMLSTNGKEEYMNLIIHINEN